MDHERQGQDWRGIIHPFTANTIGYSRQVRGQAERRKIASGNQQPEDERIFGGDCSYLPNQQADHLSPCKAYPILFHTENKQLAKISSLTANDLETSEVPYFTSFCIKSKERL